MEKLFDVSVIKTLKDAINKCQEDISKLMQAQKEINLEIIQRLLALEIQ